MEARGETAAPNASEALCRPDQLGERAKDRDARYPVELVRYWGRERRDIEHPYPGRSLRVRTGRAQGGNDARPKLGEKSDHPIVAVKPVKAGGAKEVTSWEGRESVN